MTRTTKTTRMPLHSYLGIKKTPRNKHQTVGYEIIRQERFDDENKGGRAGDRLASFVFFTAALS